MKSFQEVSIKLFEFFYSRVYRGSSFKLDLSIGKQQKMLENFNKIICNHLNMPEGYVPVNYLLSYFSYAFAQFHDKTLQRKISLNWIIGKKMFKRFLEKKEGVDYYTNKYLLEIGVSLDEVRASLHEPEDPEDLDPIEDKERGRFFGEAKLFNCIQNTTLYNHRSLHCMGCENRIVCKSILQKKFPNTFKKRGYDNISK